MNFFWGVQDSAVNCFYYCICGFQFESKTHPFNLLFCIQSFFTFVFIYSEALVRTSGKYQVYFISTAAFGTFTWIFFMLSFDLKKQAEPTDKDRVIEYKETDSDVPRFGVDEVPT